METFIGILIFIGLVIGLMALRSLFGKGVSAAVTAANKNVLFKSEYQEQQQFISTTLTFVTSASVADIKNALRTHVAPAETVPAVSGAIYQLSSSADLVTYAFGSKIYPQIFVVALSLTTNGESTQSQFKFLQWHESDGMLPSIDIMKRFRNNIIAAFTAVDSSVRITEGVLINN